MMQNETSGEEIMTWDRARSYMGSDAEDREVFTFMSLVRVNGIPFELLSPSECYEFYCRSVKLWEGFQPKQEELPF